jgi:hypothetical protein
MQTMDLQEGEQLVLGDVRVAVLEVEGGAVVLRITEGDDVREERLKVPAEVG